MKIGVFDSGIGGKSVAEALEQAFPQDDIMYVNDHENVPYGTKSVGEIKRLSLIAIAPLVSADCKVIVIACNTASTNAIGFLRASHPDIFFVGLEPMIKPAALFSKTKKIAVCATPATLASTSYKTLKDTWAKDVTVIEPNCSSWATLIEAGHSDQIDVTNLTTQLITAGCDSIVLGCTHYHWLKDRFVQVDKNISILEPTDAIAERITHFKKDYSEFTAATN